VSLDELRTWTPADALRHAGASPSRTRKGRWTPCPLCGGADVQTGQRVWTCYHCSRSLDAVGTGRALSDGTIAGALAWAGIEDSVPAGYRVVDRPMVLDWTPVWTDCHWTDAAQIPALWVHEVDLSVKAWYAAQGPTAHVRAARGLAAVAGIEAVGMVWDSLLDWRVG